jgi:predicted phosphodiesterase
MKIQILSDLHQEFGQKDFIYNKADLIIIAGDLDVRTRGIEWLLNTITSIPIIYILGNHEYYGGSYPATLLKIKQKALGTNVHVLENECVDIDGIRFHGATMWTDFSLLGNPKYYGIICQERVNDYKKIL